MHRPLRILSIEDDPKDAELIQDLLEAEGIVCEVTRVDTQAALETSLQQPGIDLILADYTLPSFDGLSALKLAMKACPEVPFLFVSGTLGEEVAIEALKIGATDYVLKTRLSRLVPSVMRALREAREIAERKQAEENLRRSEAYLAEAQKLSHTGSFGWDVSSGEIFWSQETFRIFGYEPAAKAKIDMVVQRTHPEDRLAVQQLIERVSREKAEFDFEHRLLTPDGAVKYLRVVGRPSKGERGQLRVHGSGHGHHRGQARGGGSAAERELSGGRTEAHTYGELGLAGSGKRRLTSIRGMVSDIWFRSSRRHAGLGKTTAACASGGSSQVARDNRTSNR